MPSEALSIRLLEASNACAGGGPARARGAS